MEKKINKGKIIKLILLILIIVLIAVFIYFYRENEDVQNFVDYKILNKEITESSLAKIELNNVSNTYIYAFGRNIGILSNNELKVYNSQGKQEFTEKVEVSEPLVSVNGEYLAIAEKNGNKIYVVSNKNLIWQKEIEGSIERISVGKGGYVAVSVSQASYRSIVIAYNLTGDEVCKTYLSKTYAIDMDFSLNNKKLAIAKEDLSGIQIKSSIRIIDLDKVLQNSDDAIIFDKEIEGNSLITSIKYNENNILMAMLDDGIIKIQNGEISNIVKFDENTLYADVNLSGKNVQIKSNEDEKISVILRNNKNDMQRIYNITEVPKELVANYKTIAINTGNSAYFISYNGFLKRKYTSEEEIKSIVLSESLAGIIHKNKIEILEL